MSDWMDDPDAAFEAEIEKDFADLAIERYPGSRHKRRDPTKHHAEVIAVEDPGWDNKPRMLIMGGVEHEFFTIGQLATALNRKPVTIRSWEDKRWMPKARYRTANGPKGKRLYTRRQVEGMVEICRRHGVLDGKPERMPPGFVQDVIALWQENLS